MTVPASPITRLLCQPCHATPAFESCRAFAPHRDVTGICYNCRTPGPCVVCDRGSSAPTVDAERAIIQDVRDAPHTART